MSNILTSPNFPQNPNIYRGNFGVQEVVLPGLGQAMSTERVNNDISILIEKAQDVGTVNARLNKRGHHSSSMLARIERLHGINSDEYRNQAARLGLQISGPNGTSDQLARAQKSLSDTILDGDVDTLMTHLQSYIDSIEDTQDNKETALQTARHRKNRSDAGMHALKGDPDTYKALARGYDAVDPLRSGKRVKYPTASPYPRVGLLVSNPLHFEDGKLTRPRLNYTSQQMAKEMFRNARTSRASHSAGYQDAEEQNMLKARIDCYVKTSREQWVNDNSVRTAFLDTLKTRGLPEALLEGITHELESRESIRNDAVEAQRRLDMMIGQIPLGRIPTEIEVGSVEAELSSVSSLIDSLRPTDPLRAELYGRYVVDNVRLHQRLAITTDPLAFTTTQFSGSPDRSVSVKTSEGQTTLYEDGSIETPSESRRNPDGTPEDGVWVPNNRTMEDQAVEIYDEQTLDPETGYDDTRLVTLAVDALDNWDLARTSETEVIAANALRIASDRLDFRISEIDQRLGDLVARRIGVLSTMGSLDKSDPDYTTQYLELSSQIQLIQDEFLQSNWDKQIAIEQTNITKYWKSFLGTTSPKAAGVEKSELTGYGGTVLVKNLTMNELTGNWEVSYDGSATLCEGYNRRNFTPDGREI